MAHYVATAPTRCRGCVTVSAVPSSRAEPHAKIEIEVTTAHKLLQSCSRNEIPQDRDTRRDYGFDLAARVIGQRGEDALFGLYRDLFVNNLLLPESMHAWRLQERLVQRILLIYETVLQDHTGVHYDWLWRHQAILGGDSPIVELLVGHLHNALPHVWHSSGRGGYNTTETLWQIVRTLPLFEHRCYVLYCTLAANGRPHPFLGTWVTFGFVSAMHPKEEAELSRAYRTLMHACSFREFCTAYESRSIPALFARHGLRCSAAFRDIMSHLPYSRKSVWDLKHYIDTLTAGAAGTSSFPALRLLSVDVDYGYSNARRDANVDRLDTLYTQYFGDPSANPLELHRACVEGRLFAYLVRFMRWGKQERKAYASLLKKTRYPLPRELAYLGGITVDVYAITSIERRASLMERLFWNRRFAVIVVVVAVGIAVFLKR